MTPQEMERKIEFIVEQQAQFSADIMELKARQERFLESRKKPAGISTPWWVSWPRSKRASTRREQLEANTIELVGAQAETELPLSRLIAVLERRFGDDGQKPE